MHELSIAMSILDIAGEQAELRGVTHVSAIHLKLGPLSGVVPAALLSAYDLAREGSPLQAARLVIEEIPLVVYCPACQANRPAMSLQQLCCSVCGAVAPQVVTGSELEIAALEVEV